MGILIDYPLVNIQKTMERSTIFIWTTHYFYGHGFNSYFDITRGYLTRTMEWPPSVLNTGNPWRSTVQSWRFGVGSVLGVPITVKDFCVAGICVEDQDLVMATGQRDLCWSRDANLMFCFCRSFCLSMFLMAHLSTRVFFRQDDIILYILLLRLHDICNLERI